MEFIGRTLISPPKVHIYYPGGYRNVVTQGKKENHRRDDLLEFIRYDRAKNYERY